MSGNNLITIPKNGTPREKRVEWLSVGPSKRSTLARTVAVLIATILLHVGLFLALPEHLYTPVSQDRTAPKKQDIRIHMMQPQRRTPPPPPEPDRYVQATSAPENKPDQTRNFSSKDQQAAQIVESKDKTGDTPEAANGEDDKANALETGQGRQNQPTIEEIVQEASDGEQGESEDSQRQQDEVKEPQPSSPPPSPPAPAALASEKTPTYQGRGVAEYQHPGQAEKLPEKPSREREIPAVNDNNPLVRLEQPQVDPSAKSGVKLQPRKRLNLGMSPTVVRRTAKGLAVPSGAIAFDSKLSEFGDYLNRMFEAIGNKWQDLNDSSAPSVDDTNTHVLVTFYVNKLGQVEDLKVVESTSSQTAQWRCLDAIQSTAPYFEWTKDMVVVLGDRQPVAVDFLYR
ncbi:MAG TPA: hypothetical protein PKI32_00970 [Opitutales bacterium]|nr:hypothetical protein [Opitutales bacterium]